MVLPYRGTHHKHYSLDGNGLCGSSPRSNTKLNEEMFPNRRQSRNWRPPNFQQSRRLEPQPALLCPPHPSQRNTVVRWFNELKIRHSSFPPSPTLPVNMCRRRVVSASTHAGASACRYWWHGWPRPGTVTMKTATNQPYTWLLNQYRYGRRRSSFLNVEVIEPI